MDRPQRFMGPGNARRGPPVRGPLPRHLGDPQSRFQQRLPMHFPRDQPPHFQSNPPIQNFPSEQFPQPPPRLNHPSFHHRMPLEFNTPPPSDFSIPPPEFPSNRPISSAGQLGPNVDFSHPSPASNNMASEFSQPPPGFSTRLPTPKNGNHDISLMADTEPSFVAPEQTHSKSSVANKMEKYHDQLNHLLVELQRDKVKSQISEDQEWVNGFMQSRKRRQNHKPANVTKQLNVSIKALVKCLITMINLVVIVGM